MRIWFIAQYYRQSLQGGNNSIQRHPLGPPWVLAALILVPLLHGCASRLPTEAGASHAPLGGPPYIGGGPRHPYDD
jgi:hypothetical protein